MTRRLLAILGLAWLAPAAPALALDCRDIGGVRPAFELQAKRRRGGAGDSDADQLSRLTHVPAGMWLFLFHAVSVCSLLGGGRWLLGL